MNNEKLLYEATRYQLLDKSKRKAEKVKSYNSTRYDRRNKTSVKNENSAFNQVDFDSLFKKDTLNFLLPVKGETDDYQVGITFDGLCEEIKRQLRANKYKLEYKCIYKAVIHTINNEDIKVQCSCSDYKYRHSYWGSKQGYHAGVAELRPADFTNPLDTAGAGCKHILRVLDNLDWAMKLAISIFNYIKYMESNQPRLFRSVIFPAIYDISWSEYLSNVLHKKMTDPRDEPTRRS